MAIEHLGIIKVLGSKLTCIFFVALTSKLQASCMPFASKFVQLNFRLYCSWPFHLNINLNKINSTLIFYMNWKWKRHCDEIISHMNIWCIFTGFSRKSQLATLGISLNMGRLPRDGSSRKRNGFFSVFLSCLVFEINETQKNGLE